MTLICAVTYKIDGFNFIFFQDFFSIQAPELGYVKESSETQYVPDVFYKVSFHDK
jgi:hypothetical protein